MKAEFSAPPAPVPPSLVIVTMSQREATTIRDDLSAASSVSYHLYAVLCDLLKGAK